MESATCPQSVPETEEANDLGPSTSGERAHGVSERCDSGTEKSQLCQYAGCGARFSRPSRLEIHYRTHTGERPFACDRPGCDRSYTRRQHLRRHIEVAHLSKHSPFRDIYRCPVEGCAQQLSSQDSFRKHVRSHRRRRQHTCDTCGRGFLKRQQLRVHQHDHTGERPFHCQWPGCGRQFVLPSRLRAHQLRHDKHRCTNCGQQLASWTQLVQHRRRVHPVSREYKCSQCEGSFLTNSALKMHKKVHGETRDIFHCPFEDCPRYYYFRNNLNAHIRASHEGKGFICPVETCKKKLTTKQKLDQHARLHDPGRPRRRQKPRRQRTSKPLSAFSRLTGEPEPEPEPGSGSDPEPHPPPQPALSLPTSEVARVVACTHQLQLLCARPSCKPQQLVPLGPPASCHLDQLQRAESESESYSDECALP